MSEINREELDRVEAENERLLRTEQMRTNVVQMEANIDKMKFDRFAEERKIKIANRQSIAAMITALGAAATVGGVFVNWVNHRTDKAVEIAVHGAALVAAQPLAATPTSQILERTLQAMLQSADQQRAQSERVEATLSATIQALAAQTHSYVPPAEPPPSKATTSPHSSKRLPPRSG